MNLLFEAALRIQSFLEEHSLPFCFIGGLAVQRWGEPRVTQDVDLTILTEFKEEESIVRLLLEQFTSRIDDPGEFALANRVLLLRAENGVALDISLGGLPFEKRAVENASKFAFLEGIHLNTVGPTELTIMKAFAARDRDWEDVKGIFIRSGTEIDFEYVLSELKILASLKEEPEILERVLELKKTLL